MTLEQQIARDIRALRRNGGAAADLAQSKISTLAAALARTMAQRYSYGELEAAIGNEVSQFPSLREEHADSMQEKAAKKAERATNPTRDDLAAMPAADKLALANTKAQAEREAAATKASQTGLPGFSREQINSMSAFKMLELANRWKRLGMKEGDLPKPLSPEQLKASDASRRLYEANRLADDAAKIDKARVKP